MIENQVHGNKSVETIFFEKVYSGKGLDLLPSCYKATHEITQTDSDFLRQFIIKFNDIPKMIIYFTSESNSYGITQKRWVDGRVFETDLEIERYCKQTAEHVNKSLQFIMVGTRELTYTLRGTFTMMMKVNVQMKILPKCFKTYIHQPKNFGIFSKLFLTLK